MKKAFGSGWQDVLDEALRKFPIGSRVFWKWKRRDGWIQYEGVVQSYEWAGSAARTFGVTTTIRGGPWLQATVKTDTRRTYKVTPEEMRKRP